jgi:hypothetical protein
MNAEKKGKNEQTVKLSGNKQWRWRTLPLITTAPRPPPLAFSASAPDPSSAFMDADFRVQGRRISRQHGQETQLMVQADSFNYNRPLASSNLNNRNQKTKKYPLCPYIPRSDWLSKCLVCLACLVEVNQVCEE